MLRWIAAGLVSAFSILSMGTPSALATECNGKNYLCDRRYDQVAYPTSHNATAFRLGLMPTIFVPNQDHPVDRQLEDGMRAFMIDVYYWKNSIYTCHGLCGLGSNPLLFTLQMFKEFLDKHPNEVLSIIFESYVKAEDVETIFREAGLLDRVWSQPLNKPWATLREILAAKKNLVIFTEDHDSPLSWYHPVFTYAVETHFSVKREKDFNCKYNRGDANNSLFILNHFVTRALFRRAWNNKPNRLSSILKHANGCWDENQKFPNFITVDFERRGTVVQAVDILNREFQQRFISQNQN